MSEISRKWTNKGLSKNQKGKWRELAELLSMEFDLAAARTKSVSDVPAFLTEHLRRRLLDKSVSVEEKVKAGKSTKHGIPDNAVEQYQAEPLTEKGRKAVLKTMQEYFGKGQQEFVISQQASYTSEDWEWLMKHLETE